MPYLNELLSRLDNTRRVAGRNLSDLMNDPMGSLQKTAWNVPQLVKEYGEDPMNFIGGGVGRIGSKSAGLASRTGTMHQMGLIDDTEARRLFNNPNELDPEFLDMMELELVKRGGPVGRPAPRIYK